MYVKFPPRDLNPGLYPPTPHKHLYLWSDHRTKVRDGDKFVLKTWISRKVFYFVGILSVVRDIFLPGCSKVLLLLNVWFRAIFEPNKSLVQRRKSCYR